MNSHVKIAFGDFQTPPNLARQVAEQVSADDFAPQCILEPTCGEGSLLAAACGQFSSCRHAWGVDLNPGHLRTARQLLKGTCCELIHANAFDTDWQQLLPATAGPLLIIGNPPWVTNARQGALGSTNLPAKRNREGMPGIEALTGSSNFDIAESILLEMLQVLETRRGRLAMLCKTSVARRLLKTCWQQRRPFDQYEIWGIDSRQHFGAQVDACLFVVGHAGGPPSDRCTMGELGTHRLHATIGWRQDRVVANLRDYDRLRRHYGSSEFRWRSGIKHDCAAVFELQGRPGALTNGTGQSVDLETDHLFPLLKSSALLRGESEPIDRWMLVTQHQMAADTSALEKAAPQVWDYLQQHRDRLSRRASRVYQGRPAFAMFGIGDYTFAPWKIAISGFAKRPQFVCVGPLHGKPVVFDDTCYALGFSEERQARQVCGALNSPAVQRAIAALVFPDAKRPITAQLLNQVNPMPS